MSYHTERLVQLASCRHPVERLNALVHSVLSSIPVLLLQFLVFVAALGNIIVNPVECVRHVVIFLTQSRSVADGVCDDSAVWLNEIDLERISNRASS